MITSCAQERILRTQFSDPQDANISHCSGAEIMIVQSVHTAKKNHREHRTSIRIAGTALIILILLIAIEICSFIAIRYVIVPLDSSLIYQPPEIEPSFYKVYSEYQHPVLGWATETPERRFSARHESRPNSLFPNTSKSCVSIYGDSFTFGDEVDDDEAWGNVLSGLINCKVANFGTNGYGMDQAYLRYKLNDSDQSPISVLGIYPDDFLRNLNQYRPFLAGPHALKVGLKPRFVIDEGSINLVAPPKFSYEELLQAISEPELFFPQETFLPGSEYGPQTLSFPYTLTLLGVLKSESIQSYVKRRPAWMAYLNDEHSTGAIKIADHIIRNFVNTARERGHRSLVVIFPTPASIRYYKRTDKLATGKLLEILQRNDIIHLDLHQGIVDYLSERNYREILTENSHYNAEGNYLIASLLKPMIEIVNNSPTE